MPISVDDIGKPQGKGISIDSLGGDTPPEKGTALSRFMEPYRINFLDTAGAAISKAVHSFGDDPANTMKGGAKALGSGVVDLSELAATGITGLVTAASGGEFESGRAGAAGQLEHLNKFSKAITEINLSPENKEEQAMSELLQIIPNGIHTAGNTVYEKTGSALAGASSEALLTLLTLKPSVAGKAVAGAKTGFDALVVKNPEGASALADHIGKADPKLGKDLETKVNEGKDASQAQEEVLGKDLAKSRVRIVGETPEGKPRVRMVNPEEASANIRSTITEGYKVLQDGPPRPPGAEDPPVFMDGGKVTKQSSLNNAFRMGVDEARKIPGAGIVEGKMKEYFNQLVKISPELGGPEAKAAAAILGKHQFERIIQDSQRYQASEVRRSFWNHRMKDGLDFIFKVEEKKAFTDPALNEAATAYKKWGDELYKADAKAGIKYEAVDSYIPRLFKNIDAAKDYLDSKYGSKWGDPNFTKERGYTWLRYAVKPKSQGGGGLELVTTNPEELMLMRDAASSMAHMKIGFLEELASYGLARKIAKGDKLEVGEDRFRAPNGDIYFVKGPARQVLQNAFDTNSAWNWKGLHGDVFRGAMGLKNMIVPAMLQLSLYHPVHVTWGMYNSAMGARFAQEMLSGDRSLVSSASRILSAQTMATLPKDLAFGGRLDKALAGKLDPSKLSEYDKAALDRIREGGLLPQVQSRFRIQAIEGMKTAWQKGEYWKVPFQTPFALVQLISKPTMEVLVPRLKLASYARDTESLLKMNPELHTDNLARMMAFRRAAKNTENRFGEMAYNQRFWNKMTKDIGVASSLAMGWEIGFLDEFMAGPVRGATSVAGKGVKGAAKAGELNQSLFVGSYITTAMLTGGIITYFATGGQMPHGMDYFMPRDGGKNPDGTDSRINTPFYTREFASLYKHSETEGVATGVGRYFANKATPVIGRAWDFVSNTDFAGREISDPNAPAYTRLQQKLAAEFADIEPIAYRALQQEADPSVKSLLRDVAGFTPAPKYATDTPTEASIKSLYQKYNMPKATPYERAEFSNESHQLRRAYDKGDMETYDKVITGMREKFQLTAQDEMRLTRGMLREQSNPSISMFSRLTWQQQKVLLDKMSPEEREVYLPHANKEHLKFSYEAPE